MKKIITEKLGVLGPFDVVEVLEDRYSCDGAHVQFSICGTATVEDWTGPVPIPPAATEAKAVEVREERNKRLSATDWRVIKHLELNENIPGVWEVYRQALRDVPEQPGFPWEVTWPNEP